MPPYLLYSSRRLAERERLCVVGVAPELCAPKQQGMCLLLIAEPSQREARGETPHCDMPLQNQAPVSRKGLT